MAELFTRSIVCPVLIGRRPHLDTLVQLIEQVYDGHGQTVLIAGEAGIGKSRLVTEATMHCRSSAHPAVLILQGRCFEPDTVLPYAPLLDVLRSFFTTRSPVDIAASLGPSTPELVKLLPELAPLLSEPTSSPILDPEQEKRRLYQTLTHFFTYLSSTQPLLLIIEDVHWSDEASMEVLLILARRISSHPILLLLTYRSEEVHSGLSRFLAAFDRDRLAIELILARLSLSEVGAMLRSIFGMSRPVRTDVLETIYMLTEGNPFFIEEMLKALITADEIVYTEDILEFKPRRSDYVDRSHIPRSVQVVVQQRLDHLTPDARQLLDLAAVAGRRFDLGLLQQLTQRKENELVHLVKKLITAQLVVEESEDVFAFRHALTRQAVYNDLLARERKALHRSIGETLEHMYVDTLDAHLGNLAYHFYLAGEWARVLQYAPRAGEKAQALYAPRAALEHFTHALEAARQLHLPPPLSLYRARGQVYETLGEFEHARSDYERALDAAHSTQDLVAEWYSLLDLGMLWTERDYEQAGTYFQRAIELARSMGDPNTLARTLNRVGNWHANLEQPHEGLRYHQEALDIFHGLNDQRGLAETLDFLGTTSLSGSNLIAGVEYYKQAIALLRALGDRQRLVSSLGMATMRGTNHLSSTLVWLTTNGAECIRDAEEALALARQIGWRSGEAFAFNFLGLTLGSRGEYAQALASSQAALDIATEIEHSLWMTFAHFSLGSLALDLLALSLARQHLEQALSLAKETGSLFWSRIITGSLASTCVAQGDLARAESVLDAASGANLPMQTLPQRIVCCAHAELELARHHPESTLQIIDQLITSANVEPEGVIPRLWHLRAGALVALNRTAEAEAVLQAAYATAQVQGTQPILWRICLTLGKLYSAQARRKQAEELFSQARTIVEELAANVPDDTLHNNFLRIATPQIPRLPQSSPRRAARQAFAGLTEREREVAGLIAEGKSNRALADELIVSERTIEKHVERIMSKLDFTSRTQIAVWASEKGLVKHSD